MPLVSRLTLLSNCHNMFFSTLTLLDHNRFTRSFRMPSALCRITRSVAAAILFANLPLAAAQEATKDRPPTAEAAAESIEGKSLKNIRQLTADFTKAGEGYFSPDSGMIIYQAVPRDY